MGKLIILFVLLSCSVSFYACGGGAGNASSVTYYVSPAGNDSGSGTSDAPFKTIQKAADIVNPGDTVIVKDGVYRDTNGDDAIVSINRAGASLAWITFRSENKWGAVLDGNDNSTRYCWLHSGTPNYVRIVGFEMKGCIMAIQNNVASHDVYVFGNYIHDIGRVATYDLNGRSAVRVGSETYNFTFDSNFFHSIGRLNPYTVPSASESTCTAPSDYVYNGKAYPNIKTCYNHDHALYILGHDHTIMNNVFDDIKSGWAIQITGGTGATDGANWNIFNNTFHGVNSQRDGHIVVYKESSGNNPTHICIDNNISSGARNSFITISGASGSSTWQLKNNLVYGATALMSGTSVYTASGNITGEDPKFNDPKNYDFHLQPGSPAIDKGLTVRGHDFDADGNLIVGTPDLGAYEYVGGGATSVRSAPASVTATASSCFFRH